MEWPEKITVEMDKDVNGIWFPSFSPFPLVYGKCDYIRADLVTDREQELNSKISDLTILLDNCKVGAVYSESIQKEREFDVIRATMEAAISIVDNADTPDCGGWNTNQISESIARLNPETILKELGDV